MKDDQEFGLPVEVLPRRSSYISILARSLKQWLGRRADPSPAGVEHLAHSADVRNIMIVFSGVEVIPTILLSFAIPGLWKIVHLVAEVALISLFLGLAAGWRTHPHVLGVAALRLRTGLSPEVVVPLSAIAAVRREEKIVKGHGLRLADGKSGELVCGAWTGANAVIDLRAPFQYQSRSAGPVNVRRIRFNVDEPAQAVRLISRSI